MRTTNPAKVGGLESTGPMTVSGDGLVYMEVRPDLDYESVRANGAPTRVGRGVVKGFSLPIYAADGEELLFEVCVPNRYDEASDILVHAHCHLDTANTNKKFKLQTAWEHFTPGTDIVPDTSNIVEVEVDTGVVAQYQSFHLQFLIDYDIDVGDNIIHDDNLHLRLRRVDASADEIAGEVVITHLGVIFRRDKLGTQTP